MSPVTQLRPVAAPSPRRRRLVSVASGKGGVGKTWFSITLSHALARAGCRTLLLDADLGLANVDVQLGLAPKIDLAAVITGRASLADAVQRVQGFDVIAGRSGSGNLASVSNDRLGQLRGSIAALSETYDQTVIDLGAGLDAAVLMLTAIDGISLVVTTSEPTALTDAYAYMKVMNRHHAGIDFRIVVNLATDHREGERTYQTLAKACQTFMKFTPPLAGVIRRDPKVVDAIRHQTLLMERHPNADAAADVEAIARSLGPPR
ncbi:MAG: P-loop NTPase [Alphaproteobacteria bacterium]